MLLVPPFGELGAQRAALDAAAIGGDVTTGLVAYWQFNDNSGTTVVDSSASPNNMILSASTGWGVNFYQFNGSTLYASAPHIAAYDTPNACTAFCWVKCPAQTPGTQGYFFAKWDGGSLNERCWAMTTGLTVGNELTVQFTGNGQSAGSGAFKQYTGTQTCLDNTWHSVAFSWNTSGGTVNAVIKMYVDGVPDPSPVANISDSYNSMWVASTRPVSTGAANTAVTPAVFYPGGIQRCRFYNIVKSNADIAAMHALGHA